MSHLACCEAASLRDVYDRPYAHVILSFVDVMQCNIVCSNLLMSTNVPRIGTQTGYEHSLHQKMRHLIRTMVSQPQSLAKRPRERMPADLI